MELEIIDNPPICLRPKKHSKIKLLVRLIKILPKTFVAFIMSIRYLPFTVIDNWIDEFDRQMERYVGYPDYDDDDDDFYGGNR